MMPLNLPSALMKARPSARPVTCKMLFNLCCHPVGLVQKKKKKKKKQRLKNCKRSSSSKAEKQRQDGGLDLDLPDQPSATACCASLVHRDSRLGRGLLQV